MGFWIFLIVCVIAFIAVMIYSSNKEADTEEEKLKKYVEKEIMQREKFLNEHKEEESKKTQVSNDNEKNENKQGTILPLLKNYPLYSTQQQLDSLKRVQNNLDNQIKGKQLMKKWLRNITKEYRNFNFETFDKNEYAILDLALFFFFNHYIEFCNIVQKEEKSTLFIRDFYKEFLDYATDITTDFNEKTADDFFWDRMETYNKIMTSESTEKSEDLLFFLAQFIARDMADNIFSEKLILEDITKISIRIIELSSSHATVNDLLNDTFLALCDLYKVITPLRHNPNTNSRMEFNWK